ncbi:MAG: leucine-rich repeat domain-containing protein [Treponema sp.]|nr:leucine-rich repeat domain-containing protein [Treponema sp.]
MKKICAPYTAALLAAALLAAGCSNPLTDPGQASEAGTVRLSLAAETPRTLFPSGITILYGVTASNGSSSINVITAWDGQGAAEFKLGVGTWNINVTGFIPSTPGAAWGTSISENSNPITVTVTSNGTVTPSDLTIKMKPIETGSGSFSYKVDLKPGTAFTVTPAGATLTLTPLFSGSTVTSVTLPQLSDLNTGTVPSLGSGYYDLTVRASTSDGKTAAKSEIVHIYNGQTTAMPSPLTFTDADFTAPPSLTQVYTQTGNWADEMANNLANMPVNTASAPYSVKLTGFNFTDESGSSIVTTNAILNAFGGKYVSLELENCRGIIEGTGSSDKLVSLTITGGSITGIGNNAFSGCTGLTEVTLPASVTAIGDSAFSGCTGLIEVTLPASVAAIGDSAFSGCTGLIEVTLPASVAAIGNNAFANSGLTAVTLPASVTAIGDSAFSGCTGLAEVICNPVTPPALGTGVFTGADPALAIKVPAAALTAYQADTGWGTYNLAALP